MSTITDVHVHGTIGKICMSMEANGPIILPKETSGMSVVK